MGLFYKFREFVVQIHVANEVVHVTVLRFELMVFCHEAAGYIVKLNVSILKLFNICPKCYIKFASYI